MIRTALDLEMLAPTEQEQEQQQEQETNNMDDFGFGDISPNTLEAEHQQEQQHNRNTQRVLATPPKKKRQRYTIQEKLCYLHNVR